MDHWGSAPSSCLLSRDLCLPALCGMLDTCYMGHYVVVIGFDAAKQDYVIRDPSAGEEALHVGAASFHAARRAFGTDEDLLVISVEGRLQKAKQQQQQQQSELEQQVLPRPVLQGQVVQHQQQQQHPMQETQFEQRQVVAKPPSDGSSCYKDSVEIGCSGGGCCSESGVESSEGAEDGSICCRDARGCSHDSEKPPLRALASVPVDHFPDYMSIDVDTSLSCIHK